VSNLPTRGVAMFWAMRVLSWLLFIIGFGIVDIKMGGMLLVIAYLLLASIDIGFILWGKG
jgi:hypothetical protein